MLPLVVCLSALAGCPRPDDIIEDPIELGHKAIDPKLVTVQTDLSTPALKPDEAQDFFARVIIDASRLPGADRPAVNLALALDVSGSMQGDAMEAAREAALDLLDALEDGDRFSLVTFGGKVEIGFASQVLTEGSRQDARIAIGGIEAKGTTEMLGGLSQALEQARIGHNPEGVNRVVLLSDGVPNQADGVANLGDQAASMGMTITSLGLGLEFDESLLTQLSQRSGGRYHYIEDSEQVQEVFAKELLQMRRVIARKLSLSLRPGPGVQIVEVLGHSSPQPPGPVGAPISVSLGELADHETREVLVRLRTSPHRDGARAELMDVTLGFEDVAAGAGYLTREAYLAVAVGGEVSEDEAAEALEVERAGERASAAVAMIEVAAIANTGQYAQALARLDAAQARAHAAAERLEDEELATQAKDMRDLAQSWAGARGTVAIAVDTSADEEGRQERHMKDAHTTPDHSGGGVERERPAMAPLSAPDPAAMRRTHAAAMEALR